MGSESGKIKRVSESGGMRYRELFDEAAEAL